MLIERRNYVEALDRRKGNGLVKVITGIRRCGKSFLLFELFKKHLLDAGIAPANIIEIAFDSRSNRPLRDPDALCAYLDSRIAGKDRCFLLLDEIQLVEDFESVLNQYMRVPGIDLYVTGSNSRFLSSDIITEFRGRGDEVRVRPLSFAEFLPAHGGGVRDAWRDYYTFGGLPHVLTLDDDRQKVAYLGSQFLQVYFADVLERREIAHADELDELVNVLASAVGSLTNPTRIADIFRSVKRVNIAPGTVKSYIGFLQDAFLIERALRFDIKGNRYINTPAKHYFTDLGLRNARLNFRQQEENHIMENIIFNELRLRGFAVDVGVVEERSRDGEGRAARRQLEVDFVANQGNSRYYVQSVYAADEQKRAQERAALLRIDDSFKKIIVTGDDARPKRDDKGFVIMGITDFLLDPNSLDY
jgi:predicted AAA+ superfamily ATPase